MVKGGHNTYEGLLSIVSLKALFKNGLSAKLRKNYKELIIPNYKPKLNLLNVQWIAGFINADGHFAPSFKGSYMIKTGYGIDPRIKIEIYYINNCDS